MASAPQTLLEFALETRGKVTVDDGHLTGTDLLELARRAATGLRNHAVGLDDGVVLIDDGTGADLLSGMLGAWWVGARPTLVAGTAAAHEVAAVGAQSGASMIVCARASPAGHGVTTYAQLRDCSASSHAPACQPGHIALDIATSGTTGTPKCISFTHQTLYRNVRSIAQRLDLGPDDVLYTPLPLSIAGVVGMVLLPSLSANATLHLGRLDGASLAHARQQMREIQPTLLYGVPYMFEFLARQRRAAGCRRLRWAICSSAPLPQATFDKVWRNLGVPPRSSYCLAEAGTVTLNISDDPAALRTTVGQPLDGVHVALEPFDVDGTKDGITPGGRIVVSGDSCGAGYRRDGALVPFPGGVVRTQDRGVFTGPYLTILGRVDDIIQVAGHNIDLGHLRSVLRRCPGLGEFEVVVEQHERLGAMPVLLAEAGSLTATTEQVISFCRQALRPVEVPREVRTVPELARTATGKVRVTEGTPR